jgi:hypothetical protein
MHRPYEQCVNCSLKYSSSNLYLSRNKINRAVCMLQYRMENKVFYFLFFYFYMSQNLHWNTQFLRFYKNHYIIAILDIERAGSRTLETFSRRDRDRDCAKFESSRRFQDSTMNPKKKSRRYRVSVSIPALDLAISLFTHSLALGQWVFLTHNICYSTVPPLNDLWTGLSFRVL